MRIAIVVTAICCGVALSLGAWPQSDCFICPPTLSSPKACELPQLKLFNDGAKYGYKDKSGGVVIPAAYDDAWDFGCGLAPVNIGARWETRGLIKDRGKWGYVNERGEVVIPIALDYARPFFDGLARIDQNGETKYINAAGATVIQLDRHSVGSDFSEGLVAVNRFDAQGTNRESTTEYFDTQGKKIFSVTAYGQAFHEGLAAAGVPNPKVPAGDHMATLYGFIDKTGNWAVRPTYAEVGKFSDGLAAVRPNKTAVYGKGDSWGYVDATGEPVIDLRFNEAQPFYNGYALVHTGGDLVVPFHFPSFWKGGHWMIIDKQGKVHQTSDEWLDVKAFADKMGRQF